MAFTLPVPNYGQSALGGGNGQLLQTILQLIGQANGGRQEARQANESRYADILKLFGDNRQRTLDSLDSMSGQQVADANKAYDDKRKNLIADLADRGLSGSTKRIAVESMTQRERDAAVNRIKDTMLQNRNAADLGFTDRATGVMERRTDSYPDPTNISAIIGQLGPLLSGAGGSNALAQLLGGPLASSTGGGYGGGQQAIHNNTPGPVNTAPPAPYAPGTAVNQRNAAANQDQNAATAELKRRAALAALHTADHQGGLSNAAPEQALLDYMQANGLANWNPGQGTPQIGFGRVPYMQPHESPAQYFPSGPSNQQAPVGYGYATGKNPAYQARLASYTADRQSYMNTPGYRQSLANRDANLVYDRPNPTDPLYFVDGQWVRQSPGTAEGSGFF